MYNLDVWVVCVGGYFSSEVKLAGDSLDTVVFSKELAESLGDLFMGGGIAKATVTYEILNEDTVEEFYAIRNAELNNKEDYNYKFTVTLHNELHKVKDFIRQQRAWDKI